MLPPGHLAGGYLATLALIKLAHPALDPHQLNQLLVIGTVFGFIPDLDHFISFARVKDFKFHGTKGNHRSLFTHTPFFWLILCGVIYLLTRGTEFGPYLALTILIGSWSHFFLDTFIHGVMLLWPLSNRKFAILDPHVIPAEPAQQNFFSYWLYFLKWYTKFICFYLEIFIVLVALFFYQSIIKH